jgi:hypothetical protein
VNPNNPPSLEKRRSHFPYVDRRQEALRRLGLPSPLLAKKRDSDLAARAKAVVEARRKTA